MIATTAPFLTDYDLYLLGKGDHCRLYEKLGAHVSERDDTPGTHFAVWAPNSGQVSVIGDFNGWRRHEYPLERRGSSGYWEGFVPGVGPGALYKYAIDSHDGTYCEEKADPCGFAAEIRPHTASKVWDLSSYAWGDDERHNYRIGVPRGGRWAEVLNSDAPVYGGSGQGNLGGVTAAPVAWHGRSHSLSVTLPPLATVVFKAQPTEPTGSQG